MIFQFSFTREDQADLEQELRLRLLQREAKFDERRGSVESFVTTVLKHQASNILRDRWCQKRDDHGTLLLETEVTRVEPSPDLALDLRKVLEQLPPSLRELANHLQRDTVTAAAKELKLSRTTIYKRMRELRERLENAGLKKYLKNSLNPEKFPGEPGN